jgi:hypothetical protein
MQRLKQNLLLAAGCTVLVVTGLFMNSRQAAAQNPHPGSAPVNIVAPLPLPVTGSLGVTGTVNVRDVDNAVRTPFQQLLRSDIAARRSFTVGADERLTIEFVTSECSVQQPVTQATSGTAFTLRITAGTTSVDHYFQPKFTRFFPVGSTLVTYYYNSTDMTRMYADPGTTVSLAGHVATFDCFVSVSGYTVPN